MATIPLPERAVAIDTLMLISGEDASVAARILDFLRTAFTGFDWEGILRTRARDWQPFIIVGLSIDAWVDEVVRQANILVASRG